MVVSTILNMFTPKLGEDFQVYTYFSDGWLNHQPVFVKELTSMNRGWRGFPLHVLAPSMCVCPAGRGLVSRFRPHLILGVGFPLNKNCPKDWCLTAIHMQNIICSNEFQGIHQVKLEVFLDVEFTCSTWIAEPKKPPLFFQEGEIHEVHEHFSCELIQLEMILGWLKAGRDTRFTKGLSNVTLGNPISFSRKKIDDDQKRDLTY